MVWRKIKVIAMLKLGKDLPTLPILILQQAGSRPKKNCTRLTQYMKGLGTKVEPILMIPKLTGLKPNKNYTLKFANLT